MSHPVPSPRPTQRPLDSALAGRLSVCLLFAAGCAVGALLYGTVRGELPPAGAPDQPAAPDLNARPRPLAPPPFAMTVPEAAAPPVDPVVTGSVPAVLPLRLALPAGAEDVPAPAAKASEPALAIPASPPEPPAPAIAMPPEPAAPAMAAPAAPAISAPPAAAASFATEPAPTFALAAPARPPEPSAATAMPAEPISSAPALGASPTAAAPEAPTPEIAAAPPVDPPAPPEPLELRSPQELCADLAAIGMHGAEWKRDSQAGEWSCTPEVERFGRDGASLFATILGIDAETVGMVRFKLNLISETVNETIKQRTVTLVNSLSKGLGLALPPEAEEALLDAAAYQFSDKNWQFVIRPQENDPARVNIFLRRVPKQQIGMRGGL